MKTINYFAPITMEKSIVINARVEDVWKLLIQIDNWSRWNKDISISKIDGEMKQGKNFRLKSGLTLKSTVNTFNVNSEFGWSGKDFGIFLVNNWKLRDAGGKTNVYVEESLEGVFALLFRNILQRNLENKVEIWLAGMKIHCENIRN